MFQDNDFYSLSKDDKMLIHLMHLGQEWKTLADVWSNQIDTARKQMDVAVVELTREFAEIVDSLEDLSVLARNLEQDENQLLDALQSSSQSNNQGVLEHLTYSAKAMERHSVRIRENVDSSITHLQFQDRINQILGHVQTNMTCLEEALIAQRLHYERTGILLSVDFSSILENIQRSYTMSEERANHSGHLPSGDDDEIIYF